MKQTANASAGASPAPLAVVLPTAFEQHDPSMKPMALQMAIQIGEKNPAIVTAAQELRTAYAATGGKYITLAKALREAKLLRKEGTLLLLGLGLTKGRASELLDLSAVGDATWAKYISAEIGFRAALKLENGPEVPPGEQSDEGETDATSGDKKKKKKVKIHDLTEQNKKAAHAFLTSFDRPLKNGKKTEWAYAVVIDGTKFYMALTADLK